ncbi:hypothetical protein QJS10_CPB12g00761 [Acorus calamus]|uniref:Uncharacterized protein n=1 Tax=Acorus calamus TaxID=4465 RepID=A0AAV9DLP6_ACOCL|nr:hypothetical protein QJS10_CPB12g00761 [Acorus calamus]
METRTLGSLFDKDDFTPAWHPFSDDSDLLNKLQHLASQAKNPNPSASSKTVKPARSQIPDQIISNLEGYSRAILGLEKFESIAVVEEPDLDNIENPDDGAADLLSFVEVDLKKIVSRVIERARFVLSLTNMEILGEGNNTKLEILDIVPFASNEILILGQESHLHDIDNPLAGQCVEEAGGSLRKISLDL